MAWWIFGPPPLWGETPESIEARLRPDVEHGPITTRKGRVVYNRKPHKFTRNDLLRIAGEVFNAPADKNSVSWWIHVLEQMTIFMMDKILDFIFRRDVDQEFVARLYYFLRNQLALVIDKLLGEKLTEALDDLWGLSGGDRGVSGGGH